MQKVELYFDVGQAASDMRKHINNGWRVHTCTMSSFMAGFDVAGRVLVVYEKD